MRQRVRTVELQLLRHGPPHNQLLSPLTNYLALCGDHPNTTLNFPLEHQSLKVRLRALRYQDSEDTRRIQLHETAALVGNMLADVPGLISELGHRDSAAETLVHLSIATTASELSLLPFELSASPPGFPGSGGSISLQTEFPVCITRRSRKVRFDRLDWNVRPRILLIASNAGGDIPLEAHYTLLRTLIEPWVYRNPLQPEGESLDDVHRHLVLLDDANVRNVRQTIHAAIDQQRPFTHIHILAHGCELPNQEESYGVAFHHPSGRGVDALDGLRLGQLLNGKLSEDKRRRAGGDQIRPIVVTLAVCDSGNTGTNVARPGASVAFNIHEAGIPLVVGSQFPLTKDGSVVLTDAIYRQLLDGCDPRVCLWEARRELFAQSSERLGMESLGRHDWASIVTFAALPPDIEIESQRLQRSQYNHRMSSKLRSGDRLIAALNEFLRQNTIGRASGVGVASAAEADNTVNPESRAERDQRIWEQVNLLSHEIRDEVRRFDRFVDDQTVSSSDYINMLGISASANKRASELLYTHQNYARRNPTVAASVNESSNPATDSSPTNDSVWLEFVWQSYRRYQLISRKDANRTWAFVQALFLKRFITFYSRDSDSIPDEELYHEWFRARYLCSMHDDSQDQTEREVIWHLTDLVELGLLRLLIAWFSQTGTDGSSPGPSGQRGVRDRLQGEFSLEQLLKWLRRIDSIAMYGDRDARFAAYACRRQLLRYRTFADMMFVKPTDLKKVKWKTRSLAEESGYSGMIETYQQFGDVYDTVVRHVIEQIEIGEGIADS